MSYRWIVVLVGFIVACELAGLAGSAFTIPSIGTWYASLSKPWFTPPNWVFAPAWTALYALMGIAAYIAWASRRKGAKRKATAAFAAFIVQLALNILWSATFFGLHSAAYGFVVIVLLWLSIFVTIALFRRLSRLSAYVMLPYIAWVTFAAALNMAVLLLN